MCNFLHEHCSKIYYVLYCVHFSRSIDMAEKLMHNKHERVSGCAVETFFNYLDLPVDDSTTENMIRMRYPLTNGYSMSCHRDREVVTMSNWNRFRSGDGTNHGNGVGDAVSVDIIGTDDANNVYVNAFKGECKDSNGKPVYVFPLTYKRDERYCVWVNDCAGRLITGDVFGGHVNDKQQIANALSCILQSTAVNIGNEFHKEYLDDQRVDMLLYVFRKISTFARELAQEEPIVHGMFTSLSLMPQPVDVLPSIIFWKLFSVDVPLTVRVSWMYNLIDRNKKHHRDFRTLPVGITTCMLVLPVVFFSKMRFFDVPTFTEIKDMLVSKYNSVIRRIVSEYSGTVRDVEILRSISDHVEHWDPILSQDMTTSLCDYIWNEHISEWYDNPYHLNNIVRNVVRLKPMDSISTDTKPLTVCGKSVVRPAFLTQITQDGLSTYWPPDIINWTAIRFKPVSVTVRCKCTAIPPQSFGTGNTNGLLGCANARITTGEEILKSRGFSTAGKAFVDGKYVDIIGIDTNKTFVIEVCKSHLSTMSFVVYQDSRVVYSYRSDTPLTIAFKNCKIDIEQLNHVSGVQILNLENELNRIQLTMK